MKTDQPTQPLGLTRRIARRLVRLYYGKVEVSDAERIPQNGPVLICANHANSLLDPVLVGIAARRPVRFMAKAPLFDTPVLGPLMRALGMIPAFRGSDDQKQVKRNLESLDVGAKVLVENDAMGIFPEGKSHDLTAVEMIRSGAARMALKAVADGAKGLKVVPVGLNYQNKEEFRSAIWIRVGEPIDVDACLAAHDGNERKARRELTTRLEQGLKEVVIHLDNPEWRPFLNDLEVLVPQPPDAKRETVFPLRQRKWLADAMNHYLKADPPRSEETANAIRTYREHVHDANVEVDAPVLQMSGARMVFTLLWQSLWMLLLFVPALVGTLFHIVPFTIVRVVAAKIRPPGRTTVSMYRLLVGLPVYGLWYLADAWWLFRDFRATLWFAWTCLLVLPFLGILALNYWRAARTASILWIHQFRFLFNREKLRELRRERDELCARLSTLGDEYHNVSPRPTPPPRQSRLESMGPAAVRVATVVLLLVSFWFAYRLLIDHPLIAREKGFDLTTLSQKQLRREMQSDSKTLVSVIRGLDQLETRAVKLQAEFAAGRRNYDNEADNDAVRQLLLSYVNYRSALLRLIWKYINHNDVADEKDQLQAFLIDYTAAITLCESSMKFVHNFRRSDETIARLNEGEPVWGIPANLYNTIERNLASESSIRQLASAGEYYRRIRPRFEEHQLGANSDFSVFHQAIEKAETTIAEIGGASWAQKFNVASKDLTRLIAAVRYDSQSALSTWIGDFKIREPRGGVSLIPPEHLDRLKKLLKPGDIIIERRNWYVSNAFLPGYWPHAALYVGTADDLKKLGLDQNAYVKNHWDAFSHPDAEDHPHVIIEAVSEGVVFTSLEHSIGGGDSAAVLRPRLDPDEIKNAILLGFSHAGKPYDFEFDFTTHDKLVCTEVVYRAYGANQGELSFPLKKILGRDTMPAIELVRKYSEERGTDDAQFELIAFIDGDERTGESSFTTDPEKFVATLDRPALTLFQGIVKEPIPGFGPLGWVMLALVVGFTAGNLVYYARLPRTGNA